MINIGDFEKMNIPKIFCNIFMCTGLFLGLLIPGFLFIFMYARNLFIDLSIVKLALLSVAFSFPPFLFNCWIIDRKIINPKETDIEKRSFLFMNMGGVISTLSILVQAWLYYIIKLPIRTLEYGFLNFVLIDFILLLTLIIPAWKKK